jgi:hypothetical protein
MNDNESIDFTKEYENNKLFDMEWSVEHENILIDWADKAMCYRWMHAQANNKYTKLMRWFTIPVIIISTVTGTANFAQERVPDEYVSWFVMLVGAMNILAGIISTISQFLKINELNESHRVSSISWDKFYRNVKIELAKNPKERIPVGQMIKLSKEEFDRLMETSPVIQNDIIQRFKNTFKHNEKFTGIKKPEICDELISTDNFRYVAKIIPPEQSIKLKKIALKIKDVNNKMKLLKKFEDDFIKAQGRTPTKEEFLDIIGDKIEAFKHLSPIQREFYVNKFLSEKEVIVNEKINEISSV